MSPCRFIHQLQLHEQVWRVLEHVR